MFEIIIAELNDLGFDLQDVKGLCGCHSFNLVVTDVATASLEAANFFNIVQKVYSFFLDIYVSMGYIFKTC